MSVGGNGRTATTPTTHQGRDASGGRASGVRSRGTPALRALGLGVGACRTRLGRFGGSPRAPTVGNRDSGNRGQRQAGGPCRASGRKPGKSASTCTGRSLGIRTLCRTHRALATPTMVPWCVGPVSFWTCQGERPAFRLAAELVGFAQKASPPRGERVDGHKLWGALPRRDGSPEAGPGRETWAPLGFCARKKTGGSICQCPHPINLGAPNAVAETW